MSRWRVSSTALRLSGAAALALAIATFVFRARRGTDAFFDEGDAFHYRLIAQDLFGHGAGFGSQAEAAYRYGRIGFPFLGWLVALGRPATVGSALVWVNVVAIALVPGLAATLLEHYGISGKLGAIAFAPVGLSALFRSPAAEPLMIALILFAFVLDARGRRRSALVLLAYAVLVKEVAVLALLPWAWRALRQRGWRDLTEIAAAVVPYAAWCVWVRERIGEFPFLAHTVQRSGAIGPPFSGLWTTWNEKPHQYALIILLTLATIVLAAGAAWVARTSPIGGLAAAFGCLTLCLGPNALRFVFEIGRLLAPAQLFGLLAIVIAWSARGKDRPAFVTLRRALTTR